MPACVPKVITGTADEICCPEAPRVGKEMALWFQLANLTERCSVGGDCLTDWLGDVWLEISCKFNEHSASLEFKLPACKEKVRCTNRLIAGTLTAIAAPSSSLYFFCMC